MKITTIILILLVGIASAAAKNVDLSTVPDRKSVQLTIYNSEDLTLVRETRVVTFKKGINPLQFSWANTLIDPTSVELKFLTHAANLEVLDTTFPHDKPQMLYWNVQSDLDGEATIQITYFTSGISWSADYACIANRDETQMGFEGFVRVTNNSGEDYEGAQVRLVVGTINLVERIAQLAQMPAIGLQHLDQKELSKLRDRAANEMVADYERKDASIDALASKPKQVLKQGLSEYFIYTIEGTETIRNGWSKRMRSFEGLTVPFAIQYRYRVQEYGDRLVRMYLLTNDQQSKLGTTPLPDGVVRVYRDNGRDGLSYLMQQSIKYVPIGDKIELNLGVDPNVVFELVKLRYWCDDIWMRLGNADLYRRVDDGALQIEVNSAVAGWDAHCIYGQRVRNYTAKPIDVEIRRGWDGHIAFRSSLRPTLFDYRTVQFVATVKPAEKANLLFEIRQEQGRNAKQNSVTLEDAEVMQ